MTRLPDLREPMEDGTVINNPVLRSEIDELIRNVPRLIRILPDVLRDRTDMRHNAALSLMTTGLQTRMDQVAPRSLVVCSLLRFARPELTHAPSR